MKMNTYAHWSKALVAAITLGAMVGGAAFADTQPSIKELEKQLLGKNKGYIVEKRLSGDVTGDGKVDQVYLLAHRFDKTSLYSDHYRLAVLEKGKTKWVQTNLPSNIDGGYEANMTLSNLHGGKGNEILLVAPTGGSGGYVNFAVYQYNGKGFTDLMDSEKQGKVMTVSGAFKDNYKVDLVLKGLGKTFTLDVRDRKPYYEGVVYEAKGGRLILAADKTMQPEPFGGGSDLITLVKNNKTGRQDLVWHTVAKGVANADSLAEIMVTWTADDKSFKPVDVKLVQIFTEEADLMREPIENIKGMTIQKGDVKSAPIVAAPATQTLLKALYAVKSTPIYAPKELERQESDPMYTVTLTYKDGKIDVLQTTETGEFIFRSLDSDGSWSGGASKGLADLLERTMKLR